MGVKAVQLVSTALQYAFEMFTSILDATEMKAFYISMLFVAFVVAYLLSPFMVTVGSDSVSKRSTDWSKKTGFEGSRNTRSQNYHGNVDSNNRGYGSM